MIYLLCLQRFIWPRLPSQGHWGMSTAWQRDARLWSAGRFQRGCHFQYICHAGVIRQQGRYVDKIFCCCAPYSANNGLLTHWGWYKILAILQTAFSFISIAFSSMEEFEFRKSKKLPEICSYGSSRLANHYAFCVITTHFECQIRHYASLSKMWENYAFYEILAPSAQYGVSYSNYPG